MEIIQKVNIFVLTGKQECWRNLMQNWKNIYTEIEKKFHKSHKYFRLLKDFKLKDYWFFKIAISDRCFL